MDIHGIPLGDRPLIAYHDHNGDRVRPRLLGFMAAGQSVAYASDAGTPLVADPGYGLMRGAIDAGHVVTSAPGPSAALAALTVAGLPNDRFTFAGFAPQAKGARRTFLESLKDYKSTVILFESPKRIKGLLGDLCDTFGQARQIAVCRELTKKFEEVLRGSVSEIQSQLEDRTLKGEIVVVIDRPAPKVARTEDIDAALQDALIEMRVKDAANHVADQFGLPKRDTYQRALKLKEERQI